MLERFNCICLDVFVSIVVFFTGIVDCWFRLNLVCVCDIYGKLENRGTRL